MRIVVAIINSLGFLVYGRLLSYRSPGYGDGLGQEGHMGAAIGMSFPLVYFGICFCTAFARTRNAFLKMVGIALHTLLFLLVITIAIKASPEGAAMFGIVGLFYGGVWLAMYNGLPSPVAT